MIGIVKKAKWCDNGVMANNPNHMKNLKPFTGIDDPRRYNKGRKPTKLKKFIKDHGVCSADVRLVLGNFLFKYSKDEIKNLIADDGGKKLPLLAYGILKAALDDIINNRTSSIELMMKYTVELPKQVTETNLVPGSDLSELSPDEVREKLDAMIFDLAGDDHFREVMKQAIAKAERKDEDA